jgi:ElaB/YqjD/DUF883 family membrane-anchored ribosome-binding protein
MQVAMKHVRENPRRVEEVRPDLPRPLGDLIEKLLSKDPEDRPQTGKEAREAMEELIPLLKGTRSFWIVPQELRGTPQRESPWMWVAIAMAIFALIGWIMT